VLLPESLGEHAWHVALKVLGTYGEPCQLMAAQRPIPADWLAMCRSPG
jgi:hypothetical protein